MTFEQLNSKFNTTNLSMSMKRFVDKELSLNLATASIYDNRPFLAPFECISQPDSVYPVSSLAARGKHLQRTLGKLRPPLMKEQ